MELIVRVDAFPEIGTGHLMRCMSLGLGLRRVGHEVSFITYSSSDSILERVKREGFSIRRLQAPGNFDEARVVIREVNPDWIVLDGYHFGTTYQGAVRDMGLRLVVIDDYAHLDQYDCDIILNQNYGAEEYLYNAAPGTRLLLGTDYVLLRPEFLSWKDYNKEISERAEKLLITMGGVDLENNTGRILEMLELMPDRLYVKIVLGSANVHYNEIKHNAQESKHVVEILSDVREMAPLMAWADAAISAGGTTVYELAYMGVPSMLSVVADNQEGAVHALSEAGIFTSAGRIREMSPDQLEVRLDQLINDKERRTWMSRKATALVDGRGVARLWREMERTELNTADRLREDFTVGDMVFKNFTNLDNTEKELVRTWRNSEEIRKWMFNDHIISLEEHMKFIEMLKSSQEKFYWLVKFGAMPVGTVSFQGVNFAERRGSFGIYMVERGRAAAVLNTLLAFWFDNLRMNFLKCEFKRDNLRASRLYALCGFENEQLKKVFLPRYDVEIDVVEVFLKREAWLKRK